MTNNSEQAIDMVAPPPMVFADPGITPDDVAAVVRVLETGWITTGRESDALERELEEYLGCPHVVALSSCTAALEVALASLGLPPGAPVGVPTWTFAASALAAVRVGAAPVLLDVDPNTLNLSPIALEAALAEGLAALVVVHFAGVPVDPAVHQLAADAGVAVIEDAAHALGASDHRGRLWGQGSKAGCFSFYATKNITSGEGGALATDDPALAAFARRYRLHGLSTGPWSRHSNGNSLGAGAANGNGNGVGYDCVVPGIKANLPDLLATLARSQLARLAAMQAQRRALVEHYRKALAQLDGVSVVPTDPGPGHADHLLVVRLPEGSNRPAVMAALSAAGIPTSIHFRPLHQLSWFRDNASVGPGGVTVADAMASRVLSLPLHPGLRVDDVDRACAALANALEQ